MFKDKNSSEGFFLHLFLEPLFEALKTVLLEKKNKILATSGQTLDKNLISVGNS